ncbi:hypothetical protein OROGR_018642 [Orobanche gracilis]
MATLSTSDDQSIDPNRKTENNRYHQEHDNHYPQPTSGYPIIISKYHQSHYYYPSLSSSSSSSFHSHESSYPIKTGPPYPYLDYYYSHQQTLIQEPNSTNTQFNRLLLILMIFVTGCMCMMTLVMWFLYGVYIPEFEVTSLNISEFNVADGAMTGTWDANLVVRNTNHDLNVDFRNVRSVILYRGNILGFAAVAPFEIQKNGKFDLGFSVPLDGKGPNVDDSVVHALDRDWSNGVVLFSLRLATSVNFSSSADRGSRQQSLTVSCDELEIINSSPAGSEGRLKIGRRSQCLISYS